MTDRIERHTLSLGDRQELRYSIFHGEIGSARGSPLLLCLHPGWDGDRPPPHYGEQFLSWMFLPAYAQTSAILLAPDCPSGAWNNDESLGAVRSLLEHVQARSAVDPEKISLVGYSAGGLGGWYFLQRMPGTFASAIMLATFPIVEPVPDYRENLLKIEGLLSSPLDELAQRIPVLPIYAIHSQDDEIMPYGKATRLYRALSDNNTQLELHSLEGIGHFEGDRYLGELRRAAPWLERTWGHGGPS